MKYIVAGTLIDGTGREPQKDMVVIVDEGRIVDVRPKKLAPLPEPEAEVIDLSAYVVLPGFIDGHEHLGTDLGDEAAQSAEPVPFITIRAVANARRLLESGITTARLLGEKGGIDFQVKRAIETGLIPGPRIYTAGQLICRTGGHAHFIGRETDGADDMRRAVREQLKAGADLIKIMVSGGSSTRGSDPQAQELSDDEIRVAVEEARRAGRKVSAHIHGGPGARVAIESGIHSLEHGSYLTEDELALMARHGTWLVSTYGLSVVGIEVPDVPEFYKEKLRRAIERKANVVRMAREIGVRVAVGNDTNHCRMDLELQCLINAGFSPVEAIKAATLSGAELIGVADHLGSIESGKLADIIAVAGDPLEDMGVIRNVVFVMKGGKPFVHPGAA